MHRTLLSVLFIFIVHSFLAPVSSAQSYSSDLAAFRTQFFESDNSYPEGQRAKAEALLSSLELNPEGFSKAKFHLELAKIAALAGNAHTTLFNPTWTQLFNRIDIQFFIDDDGLFIGGARGDLAELIGRRVDLLEGHSLDSLRELWAQYQSGTEGWRDEFLPYFIESPEILHAAGVAKNKDRITITFTDSSEQEVKAGTELEPLSGMEAVLPPSRAVKLAYMGFAPTTPLYMQDRAAVVRWEEFPEHEAVYIQFRANIDFSGASDVRALSNEFASRLKTESPNYVILDQRLNYGGDLNNTRDLMQTIPEAVGPDGHVYILVSGRTFSAGISSVGYAKQAGKDRVTIIGTPPGDVLEFWAEGDVVFLPFSKASALYSTERHNYKTGCPEADCHRSIKRNPIRVESLDPDVHVRLGYEDLVAGKDPLLDKALLLIKGHRSESKTP